MTAVATIFPRESAPFQAHGAALQLWGSKDEEILIEGPAGTGKTRAILEKVHFCMMKYPGARALLVRKTRESLNESVLTTYEEKVLPDGSPLLNGAQRKFRTSYNYPNGSRLVLGGMDKPTKIMSTEFDIIGTFETTELNEEDFENLTTRLRNHVMPYQQIIADCNPDIPQHWLNNRPKKTGMLRLLSRHEDNPAFYDHKMGTWTEFGLKYLAKLDRLSGARRLRLRMGVWAAAEGLIYEGFDQAVHVIPSFDIPSNWRRIRAVDFGYNEPFCCQWWAMDPSNGNLYRYREIYHTKRLVEDFAKGTADDDGKVVSLGIQELSEGERIEATICDHDLEDRMTLERHGIPTTPAYKDIIRGIQAVQARLRPQPPRNKPRIFLFNDALVETDPELLENNAPTCTEQEVGNYVWKRLRGKTDDQDEPVDRDNHGLDPLRYTVAYFDNLASMFVKVQGDKIGVISSKQLNQIRRVSPTLAPVRKVFRNAGRGSTWQ